PYESLELSLNDNCLQVLSARAQANETSTAALTDAAQAGYAWEDGHYWRSSGVVGYDSQQFFLATSLTNPFGGGSRVGYDLKLSLLPITKTDPAGLTTQFEIDWRLLVPYALTTPNGTTSAVTFDVLGIVTATAVQGASGEGGRTSSIDYAFYA